MAQTTGDIHRNFEPRPDAQALTGHADDLPRGVSKDGDYEPRPENSLPLSVEQDSIVKHILNLYCGSASEEDMQGLSSRSTARNQSHDAPSDPLTHWLCSLCRQGDIRRPILLLRYAL
jgi:hypothetical protein